MISHSFYQFNIDKKSHNSHNFRGRYHDLADIFHSSAILVMGRREINYCRAKAIAKLITNDYEN